MIAALIIALAAIAVFWWIGYTIRTFWRVLTGLARAIAAIGAMLWIIARALWAIAGARLVPAWTRCWRRNAPERDETNVIQFRKRG